MAFDPRQSGGYGGLPAAYTPLTSTAITQQAAAQPTFNLSSAAVEGATTAGSTGTDLMKMGTGGTDGKGGNFFGENGAASIGLGAIQTLGSLWNSFQQTKLAKKSLELQTRAFETNLANQTKTYNTALEDRINARYHTEGRSGEAAAKIEENRL